MFWKLRNKLFNTQFVLACQGDGTYAILKASPFFGFYAVKRKRNKYQSAGVAILRRDEMSPTPQALLIEDGQGASPFYQWAGLTDDVVTWVCMQPEQPRFNGVEPEAAGPSMGRAMPTPALSNKVAKPGPLKFK
jgi:hypothetical protein